MTSFNSSITTTLPLETCYLVLSPSLLQATYQQVKNLFLPETLLTLEELTQSSLEKLGLFFVSTLYPTIERYQEQPKALELLFKFEDLLKPLLIKLLPKEDDLEQFLNYCESKIDQQILAQTLAEELVSHAEATYKQAEEINEQLNRQNTLLIKKGLAINGQRRLVVTKMTDQLEHLTQRIGEVYKEMLLLKPTNDRLVLEMQKQQEHCEQVLKEFKNQIEKC